MKKIVGITSLLALTVVTSGCTLVSRTGYDAVRNVHQNTKGYEVIKDETGQFESIERFTLKDNSCTLDDCKRSLERARIEVSEMNNKTVLSVDGGSEVKYTFNIRKDKDAAIVYPAKEHLFQLKQQPNSVGGSTWPVIMFHTNNQAGDLNIVLHADAMRTPEEAGLDLKVLRQSRKETGTRNEHVYIASPPTFVVAKREEFTDAFAEVVMHVKFSDKIDGGFVKVYVNGELRFDKVAKTALTSKHGIGAQYGIYLVGYNRWKERQIPNFRTNRWEENQRLLKEIKVPDLVVEYAGMKKEIISK